MLSTLQVSTGVALYAHYLQPKPGWPVAASADYMIVFQLTSFAVALLLVFRTNTAHSRWWEVSGRRCCCCFCPHACQLPWSA